MPHYSLFDDDRRFILCVDPKCGCTTIKEWFLRIVGEPSGGEAISKWMRPAAAVPVADDYTRVWIVRDPLRRLVSFYLQFVVRDQRNWCFADHDRARRLEDSTFEDFIRIIGELHDSELRLQHHLEPQTRALSEVPFDRVVKIEDLERRSEELMELLGVSERPGHHNKRPADSEHVDNGWRLKPSELAGLPTPTDSSFWNDELRAIAHRVYAKDCAFYASL